MGEQWHCATSAGLDAFWRGLGSRLKGIGVSAGEGLDRVAGSGPEATCRGPWGETAAGRRSSWCRGGLSYPAANARGLWGQPCIWLQGCARSPWNPEATLLYMDSPMNTALCPFEICKTNSPTSEVWGLTCWEPWTAEDAGCVFFFCVNTKNISVIVIFHWCRSSREICKCLLCSEDPLETET